MGDRVELVNHKSMGVFHEFFVKHRRISPAQTNWCRGCLVMFGLVHNPLVINEGSKKPSLKR